MNTRLSQIISKVDYQSGFLKAQDLREAIDFYRTFAVRREAAEVIAEKFYDLVEGAIQSIYKKFPYIAKTSTKAERGKLVQDIQDWLRYITYSLILGNTSYLDENVLPGLFEVLRLYKLSPSWYVEFLKYVREKHNLSSDSANETNTYINYLINTLGRSEYIGECTEIYQFLSVQVYLQKSDSSQIKELTKVLKDFFTAFDFEIEIDFPAKISSWYKRLFLRTKEAISQPEIQDRVKKIERAFELQALQSTQSEIDKNQAEAVSKLLDTLSKIEEGGVLSIGSILIVKQKGYPVVAWTLTPEQMIRLQQNPTLMKNPEKVIEKLSQSLIY